MNRREKASRYFNGVSKPMRKAFEARRSNGTENPKRLKMPTNKHVHDPRRIALTAGDAPGDIKSASKPKTNSMPASVVPPARQGGFMGRLKGMFRGKRA